MAHFKVLSLSDSYTLSYPKFNGEFKFSTFHANRVRENGYFSRFPHAGGSNTTTRFQDLFVRATIDISIKYGFVDKLKL